MDLDIGKLKEFFKLVDTDNNNKISQKEIDAAKKKGGLNSVWVNSLTADMTQETFGLNVESTQKQPSQTQSEAANPTPVKPEELRAPAPPEKITIAQPEDIKNQDVRSRDISHLNLSREQLLSLTIDNSTAMSDEQKKIVFPIIEKMKDPGLGIRALHQQGITGKGVHIAIIDKPLGEHQEYSDNIVQYEEIGRDRKAEENQGEMHGASVTSLAVGKEVGVAPDADVSYFAVSGAVWFPTKEQVQERIRYIQSIASSNSIKDESLKELAKFQSEELQKQMDEYDKKVTELQQKIKTTRSDTEKAQLQVELNNITKDNKMRSGVQYLSNHQDHIAALNKILEQNKTLPKDKRISVVSISWGFDELAPDYQEWQKILERAKKEGVFVVSTVLQQTHGMNFQGTDRNPDLDPNDPKSYDVAVYRKGWGENIPKDQKDATLLVPMDHRTMADFRSTTGYRYEPKGGKSWATPYLAGTYALAKQVNPNITPEQFFKVALETSDECNTHEGTYIGRLINPQKLMEAVKKIKSE